MSARERLREAARDVFGWAELRDEQIDAMEQVLGGRDVFVVLPTGAGKSAVYQVPGVLLDGLVVVVSPLIALQRDQVTALRENGAPPAALVNSGQSDVDNEATWEAVGRGEVRYLFLSPEHSGDVLASLRAGREKAGKTLDGFEICGPSFVVTGNTAVVASNDVAFLKAIALELYEVIELEKASNTSFNIDQRVMIDNLTGSTLKVTGIKGDIVNHVPV